MAESRIRWREIRRLGSDGIEDDEERFAKGRYFDAACPSYVNVRQLVRISGPPVGGVRQVDLVDPSNSSKMPAIGVVVEKSSPTQCLVQIIGEVNGGLFSGLTPNGRYFVGADAYIVFPPPAPAPGGYMMVQIVCVAVAPSVLLVEPNFAMTRVVWSPISP